MMAMTSSSACGCLIATVALASMSCLVEDGTEDFDDTGEETIHDTEGSERGAPEKASEAGPIGVDTNDDHATDAALLAVAALPTCYRTTGLDTGSIGPLEVPSAGTTEASTSCLMGRGATSDAVRRLQVNLNECYGDYFDPDLKTDRVFGGLTEAALRKAQGAARTPDDGVYGPYTRDALEWWTGTTCYPVDGPGGYGPR
jgi:hypothetical protein